MLEQAQLAEQFRKLLATEQQAEAVYAQLSRQAGDPDVKTQALQLLREKQKHIRLTERLLEILEA